MALAGVPRRERRETVPEVALLLSEDGSEVDREGPSVSGQDGSPLLWARIQQRMASLVPANLMVRLDSGPMCSFTFDDCPLNALENAGSMLQALGVGGTFFISAGMSMSSPAAESPLIWGDDLRRVVDGGHEIGCHTFSHTSVRRLTPAQLALEFRRNADAIRAIVPGIELVSFAYPYGEVSIRAKLTVANWFGVARGVRPGLNRRLLDIAQLKIFEIAARNFDKGRTDAIIRKAARQGCWLVFMTHDVSDAPSRWGCTPAQFEYVLKRVRQEGIDILPLRAAVGRISHRPAEQART